MFFNAPSSRPEWALSVIWCGANVELDATLLTQDQARYLVRACLRGETRITLYNCLEAALDLRAIAEYGGGRVRFRL